MYQVRRDGKTTEARDLRSARKFAKGQLRWVEGDVVEIRLDGDLIQTVETVKRSGGLARKWTPSGQNKPLKDLL